MLLHLAFDSDMPIYQQIRDQIVLGIADGKLAPGQQLPTVRALAAEAGVNVMTVSKAYQLLKQEGYLQADRRSGTVVSAGRPAGGPSPQTLHTLKVCLSELRLAGLDSTGILRLVETLVEKGGNTPCGET